MALACVILAGGLGTRLRPLTERVPKALIEVAGRPFADLQLQWLAAQGVENVVYSVGFLGSMLRAHIGDGSAHGLHVDWVDEGDRPLGTGGALRLVVDSGLAGPAFFVLYGDSYLRIDLPAVEAAYRASGCPALMTVLRNDDRWDRSNAVCSGDRVVIYDKSRPQDRPPHMRWIDYGLSVLRADTIAAAIASGVAADVGDVMHDLSTSGRLACFEATERFYEIGSARGLAELEAHLRDVGTRA